MRWRKEAGVGGLSLGRVKVNKGQGKCGQGVDRRGRGVRGWVRVRTRRHMREWKRLIGMIDDFADLIVILAFIIAFVIAVVN